jgi:hypothetical protein
MEKGRRLRHLKKRAEKKIWWKGARINRVAAMMAAAWFA